MDKRGKEEEMRGKERRGKRKTEKEKETVNRQSGVKLMANVATEIIILA